MKLSEAIRKGSQMTRPSLGHLKESILTDGGTVYATCALGAAVVGAAGIEAIPTYSLCRALFPVGCERVEDVAPTLARRIEKVRCYEVYSVDDSIVVANDDLCLTREQIADLLEEDGL